MGVDLYAVAPAEGLPTDAEWDHPTMSWRLWEALIDLLTEQGADVSGLSHANDGQISEQQARGWAAALRPIAGQARRYRNGSECWFELGAESADAIAAGTELADPDTTHRWLLFVADYLEHSGGCLER